MENKSELINSYVYKGFLPLAFINSKIVKIDEKIENQILKKESHRMNSKYYQTKLPDACSPLLLSKIYEIY